MGVHPTADEVYQVVRKRLPRISLGTVYRNLDVLSESGEISRLDRCGAQYRFDGDLEQHYHIRCSSCGRVDDIEGVFRDRGNRTTVLVPFLFIALAIPLGIAVSLMDLVAYDTLITAGAVGFAMGYAYAQMILLFGKYSPAEDDAKPPGS